MHRDKQENGDYQENGELVLNGGRVQFEKIESVLQMDSGGG
jgi:hypothetical protein